MDKSDAARRAEEFVETYGFSYPGFDAVPLQQLHLAGADIATELREEVLAAADAYENALNDLTFRKQGLSPEKLQERKSALPQLKRHWKYVFNLSERLNGLLMGMNDLVIEKVEAELAELERSDLGEPWELEPEARAGLAPTTLSPSGVGQADRQGPGRVPWWRRLFGR